MDMKETNKKITHEEFKAGLLAWKERHVDEYNRFARQMRSGDTAAYIQFYADIIIRLPGLSKRWQQEWNSDSVIDFDDMVMTVSTSSVPQNILDEYSMQKDVPFQEKPEKSDIGNFFRRILGMNPKRDVIISAPLILCWLYFGKSFEAMYELIETQMNSDYADNMDKEKCSFAGKQIIKASINGGFRTIEDWDKYFHHKKAITSGDVSEWAMSGLRECSEVKDDTKTGNAPVVNEPKTSGRKKADNFPLMDYLNCGNKDAVIDVIRKFIIDNNTGNGLALPYFALSELGLFKRLIDAKEYSIGITKQYENIENLKSESSCRQALGNLRKQQFVTIDGKQRNGTLLESDEFAPKLEQLKKQIADVNNGTSNHIQHEKQP